MENVMDATIALWHNLLTLTLKLIYYHNPNSYTNPNPAMLDCYIQATWQDVQGHMQILCDAI